MEQWNSIWCLKATRLAGMRMHLIKTCLMKTVAYNGPGTTCVTSLVHVSDSIELHWAMFFCTMESHWSMQCWLNRVPLPFFTHSLVPRATDCPVVLTLLKSTERVTDIPSLIPPRPAFRCTWCLLVPLVTFPEETQTHSTFWPFLFFQPVFHLLQSRAYP